MNQRRLSLELMRAILRSSSLTYDDVFPIVAPFASQVSGMIIRLEREIQNQKSEEQRTKNAES